MAYPSWYNAKFALSFAIFLATLAGGASGASPQLAWDSQTLCSSATAQILANANEAIVAVAMLIIIIIALAYMIGEGFEKQELTFWAKTEFQNAVISAILIAAVVGTFGISCEISKSIVGSSAGGDAVMSSYTRIEKLNAQYGTVLTKKLVQDAVGDQMKTMSYIYWGVPYLGGRGMAYGANWRAVAQHRELLAEMQMPIMASLKIQALVLKYISLTVVALLLPAAALLRMVFFTRDAGNYLIALSFALFFIYPLTYVIILDAYKDPGGMPLPKASATGMPEDWLLGNAMLQVGYITPLAIIAPNLALILTISFTMAAGKALKGLTA